MTNAARQPQSTIAVDLLDDLLDRIQQLGWRPYADVVIAAAKRRAGPDDIEDHMALELAIQLAGRPYANASALSIVDDWPGTFDPLDRDRRPEPPYRRHAVQQLCFIIDDAEEGRGP